jgi:hypothetical protein
MMPSVQAEPMVATEMRECITRFFCAEMELPHTCGVQSVDCQRCLFEHLALPLLQSWHRQQRRGKVDT